MKTQLNITVFALGILVSLTLSQRVYASPPVTGPLAVDLLGQYDQTSFTNPVPEYTKNGLGDGPNLLGLKAPKSVAVDVLNHRLFLLDAGNNRILVYNLTGSNTFGDFVPDYVIGQPNFASNAMSLTDSSLYSPEGLTFDSSTNHLFVSDSYYCRVLVFDTTTITNGMAAAYVIGQPNFTTGNGAVTAVKLNTPAQLVIDPINRRLFVADRANHRVMVYNLNALASGMSASYVLGQVNFVSSNLNISQTEMFYPRGMAYDVNADRLFVSDEAKRVLVFDVAVGVIANGEPASYVLGQPNFGSGGFGQTQNGLGYVTELSYDPDHDRLFVSQETYSRITAFDVAVGNIANNMNASSVLGQANFTSGTSGASAAKLNAPLGVFWEPGGERLYVADGSNNRVNIYNISSITDGESATTTIGQYDGSSFTNPVPAFNRSRANGHPTQFGMGLTSGVSLDAIHHRLFVLDVATPRVLVFNLNSDNTLIDHIPDNVLGQSDFLSSATATAQNTFTNLQGLAYDSAGNRLFVADENRVLVFDVAAISDGENAANVLGQINFTTNNYGATQSTFTSAGDLAVDTVNSRLFVADKYNSRILVFSTSSISDGMTATHVIGQPNFVTSGTSITQAGLSYPAGVAYDSDGNRLFVADGANRVTVYNLSGISDGMPANYVLGQTTFTASASGTTQSKFAGPNAVTYDLDNQRLYVSESYNNRVTIFNVATSAISNGLDAIGVIGQSDYTTSNGGPSRAALSSPSKMNYDATKKQLYIAESDSNRVSVFPTELSLSYSGGTFAEAVANDGSIASTVTVTLLNDIFAVSSGVMTSGVHYSVANLPAGLTTVVTGTSATTATITLAGHASAHESTNNVSNFTLNFLSSALTLNPASAIENNSKSNFAITFDDVAPTPTPTTTPTPSSTSTPTPTPTAIATATATATPTVTPSPTPQSELGLRQLTSFSSRNLLFEVTARRVTHGSLKPVNNARGSVSCATGGTPTRKLFETNSIGKARVQIPKYGLKKKCYATAKINGKWVDSSELRLN